VVGVVGVCGVVLMMAEPVAGDVGNFAVAAGGVCTAEPFRNKGFPASRLID
jgi:hypothetical protein